MVGMDLLAQVGHGHCSHAAERQADQCAHQQNAMPAGRQRTTDGEHRGSEQEATSTCLRPMASEIGPVISRPTARVSVESERIKLLCAALMPNACDSMGIIGCTQ